MSKHSQEIGKIYTRETVNKQNVYRIGTNESLYKHRNLLS